MSLSLFLVFSLGVAFGQQTITDSLKQCIVEQKAQDTNLVNLYTQLGNELLANKTPEEVLDLGTKAKRLADELKFDRGRLNAMNVLAKYYQDVKEYKQSQAIFEEYIAMSKTLKIPQGVMQGKNNLALVYFDKGDYPMALHYHFAALKEAESLKDYTSIPIYYSNIARVYYASNQYEKAIEYTENALKIEEEHNASPKSIIIRSINLSTYYTDFGYPEKTIHLLKRMLAFNDSTLQNPVFAAYMHANLGDAYIHLEKYLDAIDVIILAYPTFEGSDRMRAQLDLNLANANSFIGKTATALSYLEAGLGIAHQSKEPEFERFAYETASLVYKNLGNHKQSLDYFERASILKDSLLGAEQSNAIVQMQILFETQQKEDSIAMQTAALANERAVSDQKSWLLRISVVALIVVTLLSFFIVRLYRKAKHQKEAIEQKNEENELLLGEIHHRVKNNLQVISSLLALQERSITDDKARSAIVEGRERVQSIGLIHKHLYQNNQFSNIEMKGYITHLLDGLLETMSEKSKPVQLEVDIPEYYLDVDSAVPLGLMINELVVNALKHAYTDVSEPLLRVSLRKENEETVWEVVDNGHGKKEDVEQSSSFGMKMIRSLTRQLGASFQVNEKDGLSFGIRLKPTQT